MGDLTKITKILDLGQNREEYFENPVQDYFNVNKFEQRFIKGIKKGSFIKHVPDNYGPSGSIGYALMRGLNCQGACAYCYLQTYFKSPDIVRFSNIDEIISFLDEFIVRFKSVHGNEKILYFYDGDFQDSFGYFGLDENILHINKLISLISNYDNVFLEVRTKCIMSKNDFSLYDDLVISDKVIYAITFSPSDHIQKYERGTSDLKTRFNFAKYVVSRGGRIGIRIDPIIIDNNLLDKSIGLYVDMVESISRSFEEKDIFNRTFGVLRLKDRLHSKLKKSIPEIVNGLSYDEGFRRYDGKVRNELYDSLKKVLRSENYYICMD